MNDENTVFTDVMEFIYKFIKHGNLIEYNGILVEIHLYMNNSGLVLPWVN